MADPGDHLPPDELRFLLVLYESADAPDEAPEGFGAVSQILERHPGYQLTTSGWLVKTAASPAALLQSLKEHITPGDRVLIGELSEMAWQGLENGHILFDDLREDVDAFRAKRS